MAEKVWTKETTLELIRMYEAHPEIWDSRHMHYKDRDKRSMCWQSMGEAMNTSVAEVQLKIHNLLKQVVYYMYCVLCVKWTVNLYIALCT
jgi:hypothetical protein